MSDASTDGNGIARGLQIIGASAGSGKTHRLTQCVVDAIRPGSDAPVRIEGVVAVTYTRKAHVELASRVRRALIADQAFERAQALPLAYLGTVHAVSLRLLKEFAFDAGLSPDLGVLAHSGGRLLREALESTLDVETRARMATMARRLGIGWDPMERRSNWLPIVAKIMELARTNRIGPDASRDMAQRSSSRILTLLGTPITDGRSLNAKLTEGLARAIKDLRTVHDGQKNTATCLDLLCTAHRKLDHEGLDWCDWVKLASVGAGGGKGPGKAGMQFTQPLADIAADYARHPDLHADIREFTDGVYEAARRALSVYTDWKARRRVADYVDILDRALTLVDDPVVAAELAERLDLVVVDEFQDTSPIQLALFVGFHRIAKRSIWVGDRKQCIFEFAEADPALMDAVTAWVAREGGMPDQLPNNWRSRPDLVEASSSLFAHALALHGFAAREVVVSATRVTPPRLAGLPPFGCFWLDTTNAENDARAIAEGVRRLLAEPSATPVVDRTTGEVRDLRASDVAVLMATNKELSTLAAALKALGIRASFTQRGLFDQPEGTLVDAGLRFVVDSRDTLALATLEALTGAMAQDPDAWLDRMLDVERARMAHAATNAGVVTQAIADPAETEVPGWKHALMAVRERLHVLSPREAIDAVMGALDAAVLCARWPDPEQRLGNLEAIRKLAAGYEEQCVEEREAATLAGLLRCFELASEPTAGDLTSDAQHVPTSANAVTLVTIYRAKGLEWPVVVLGSLSRSGQRSAFDVVTESDRAAFDPSDPLGDRWIRYWPWPFGSLAKVPLADAAERSAEGIAVAIREQRERARLAYVAMTRARDHLIFAARKGNKGVETAWLNELADSSGHALMTYPGEASPEATIDIRRTDGTVLRVPARVWCLRATDAPSDAGVRVRCSWPERPTTPTSNRPRYGIAPSRATTDWSDLRPWRAGAVVPFTRRLQFARNEGIEWNVVGDMIHAFFATDVKGLSRDERLLRAQRLLNNSGVQALFDAQVLLDAGDALKAAIDARYPGATWLRELPVTAWFSTPDGERRLDGAIDLLLETAGGVVIVDHKTFRGGREDALRDHAEGFGAQIAAYARALEAAGKHVVGAWIHFAIGGTLVEMTKDPLSAGASD